MANEVTFVKYCPLCGTENPRYQAFCTKCQDGDLSTVPGEPLRQAKAKGKQPVPATTETVQPDKPDTYQIADTLAACTLELVDNPAIRFTVREDQTVGRASKADVVLAGVPKLDWISGVHARFIYRNEQWFVQHMGQTNFIKVDGEIYKGKEEVALYHGSILVLSLTPFRVVLEGA